MDITVDDNGDDGELPDIAVIIQGMEGVLTSNDQLVL